MTSFEQVFQWTTARRSAPKLARASFHNFGHTRVSGVMGVPRFNSLEDRRLCGGTTTALLRALVLASTFLTVPRIPVTDGRDFSWSAAGRGWVVSRQKVSQLWACLTGAVGVPGECNELMRLEPRPLALTGRLLSLCFGLTVTLTKYRGHGRRNNRKRSHERLLSAWPACRCSLPETKALHPPTNLMRYSFLDSR